MLMRSIIRGHGLHRLFGLAVVAVMLGVVAGVGSLPVRGASAQPNGTIAVQKQLVLPDGMNIPNQDMSGFVFTVTPLGSSTPIALSPTNTAGQTAISVAPGTYTISEQQRAGSTFLRFVAGGQQVGTFTVTAGMTTTLTAVNQVPGAGQIVVQKQILDANNQVVSNAPLAGFVFTIAGPGGFSQQVTTGANGQTGLTNLAAGTYTVTETVPPNFTLVSAAVDGSAAPQAPTFQLTGAQTRNVLFNNRQGAATGTLTITKQVVDSNNVAVPNATRSGFAFTLTCGTAFNQTVTTDANGAAVFNAVPAGGCTLQENLPAGFTFVSATAPGAAASTSNPSTFTVVANQTLAITVLNRQGGTTGTVTVTKQLVDTNDNVTTGDRSGFQFTVTCGQFSSSAVTDANGIANILNVPAGSCTINEATRTGFTQVSFVPSTGTTDIGNNGGITVTGGQTFNITVRNRAGAAATEAVALPSGCSNVALTWPVGTPLTTVAAAITPVGALESIFKQDLAQNRFRGFSPAAPAFANDYFQTETSLEAVFICMRSPGTLNRPAR